MVDCRGLLHNDDECKKASQQFFSLGHRNRHQKLLRFLLFYITAKKNEFLAAFHWNTGVRSIGNLQTFISIFCVHFEGIYEERLYCTEITFYLQIPCHSIKVGCKSELSSFTLKYTNMSCIKSAKYHMFIICTYEKSSQ